MHTHTSDWLSDQPLLNQWDFPENIFPIGVGPFAFIHRKLTALWARLTWKTCHWESSEDVLLLFKATKQLEARGSQQRQADKNLRITILTKFASRNCDVIPHVPAKQNLNASEYNEHKSTMGPKNHTITETTGL